MGLRIVFAGTPEFAIPSLKALVGSGYDVRAVYTKADSPSGRGLKLTFSPIKQFVIDNYPDIPILQPVNLKGSDTEKQLSEWFADVMVVIAYGLIIPKPVISLFEFGCINVHASLLPRWRGAAPIHRAILAGDAETGVTIMQIDEGLDTGDMIYQKKCQIGSKDNAKILHDNLAGLGAEALLIALKDLEAGTGKWQAQDNKLMTYAAKITKGEAKINWHESAMTINRQIRAFNPWPVAFTYLAGQLLKVWEGEVLTVDSTQHIAGGIVDASEAGIDVATKQGIIRLLTVQIPGGKPMPAGIFLNARSNLIIPKETILGEKLC